MLILNIFLLIVKIKFHFFLISIYKNTKITNFAKRY